MSGWTSATGFSDQSHSLTAMGYNALDLKFGFADNTFGNCLTLDASLTTINAPTYPDITLYLGNGLNRAITCTSSQATSTATCTVANDLIGHYVQYNTLP